MADGPNLDAIAAAARAQSSRGPAPKEHSLQAPAPCTPVAPPAPPLGRNTRVLPTVRRGAVLKHSAAHLVAGLGLWMLTPIVASFGTLALGDRLQQVVFFGAETGSTSGDGPWTLYQLLGKILLASWALSIIILQALPVSAGDDGVDTWGVVGGFAGFAGFAYQLYAETVSASSWILVPTGWVAGLIVGSLVSRHKQHQPTLARVVGIFLLVALCAAFASVIMGIRLPVVPLLLGPP